MANRNPSTNDVISKDILRLVNTGFAEERNDKQVLRSLEKYLDAQFPTRRKVTKRTRKAIQGSVAELTPLEHTVFTAIVENPGSTAHNIAEKIGRSYGSISPRIAPMVKKGILREVGFEAPYGRKRAKIFVSDTLLSATAAQA